MTTSKRKEIKIYYASNSYDDELIKFIKDYAVARGQTYTEVMLEVLRAFWLPMALKKSPLFNDSFLLKELQGKSIGILNSQLNFYSSDTDLIELEQKSLNDDDLLDEGLDDDEMSFNDSATFDNLI
ncbi:hypothetical protein A5482_015470 (plasmid) [Cyanobacterium sp. IPPAS B-1200]|uniref:hypothetical protein n=1 Tax=Cyanobacterium sp. IPPAS B-1200 TaxID=1562720 RepID=UPI0008528B96|nr:hypothetical protein [Cyanobacterium sp. IPPAS B-1200]OEJ77705.1 hypothetical protein A5482_15295 [Cyanobacterium sp. IPPAS B-1200]